MAVIGNNQHAARRQRLSGVRNQPQQPAVLAVGKPELRSDLVEDHCAIRFSLLHARDVRFHPRLRELHREPQREHLEWRRRAVESAAPPELIGHGLHVHAPAEARVRCGEQRGERRVFIDFRRWGGPTHRVEAHVRDLRIRHGGFRSRVQLDAALRDGLGEDLQCRNVRACQAQKRLERRGTGIGEDLPERPLPIATKEPARGDGIERQCLSGARVHRDLLILALEHRAAGHPRKSGEQRRHLVGPALTGGLHQEPAGAENARELSGLVGGKGGRRLLRVVSRRVEREEQGQDVAAHLRDVAGEPVPDERGVATRVEREVLRHRQHGHGAAQDAPAGTGRQAGA